MRRALVFGLLIAFAPQVFSAITYPYALPNQLNATLKVETGSKTGFNNLLLGLNTNFPENQYGSDGYNDPDGQDLITTWNPPSLRFPHGVWANFYDWEVDGRRWLEVRLWHRPVPANLGGARSPCHGRCGLR